MIRKYFIISSVFIILINQSYTDDKLNFDFDYAVFKSANSKVYLEFYYAFNQIDLKYIKDNGGFKIGGKILLDIFSITTGKNVLMKEFNIPLNINDTSLHEKHSKLTGQINFLLDIGSYKFKIKACDIYDTANCFNVTEEIEIKPITSDAVSSSSIELASSISKSSDENNIFYKNNLEVTPNPSKLFGNNLSKVYYYIELYSLRADLLSDTYALDIVIADNEGSEIKHEARQYIRKAELKMEYGAFDIADVPSGKYILLINVINDKNTVILKASKDFYIFNSNLSAENENLSDIDKKYFASLYPKMEGKEVEDEFNKSIYIMTVKSRKQYEKLNDIDSKRKFMFLFWNALDPNPATPESEYKKDYLEKVDFANKYFSANFKEGWKTDRGRVYCIYGKYDEIERHPYEATTRAYEIWKYNNLQGGVIFVFIDDSAGFGNYLLEHSNALYEINNDKWQEKLYIK